MRVDLKSIILRKRNLKSIQIKKEEVKLSISVPSQRTDKVKGIGCYILYPKMGEGSKEWVRI